MGRKPIGTRALTNAEKQAAHRQRRAKSGRREVRFVLDAEEAAALDRIKASRIPGVTTDAEALRYVLHLVRRDGGF